MAATITQISSPPNFIMNEILICFYFWVLYPVEYITKFFEVIFKIFVLYLLNPLYVSALIGHPQAEYTII
jgi:hypothetical protein